jgi:hypothetical protein
MIPCLDFTHSNQNPQQDKALAQDRNPKCFQIHPNQYPTKNKLFARNKNLICKHTLKSKSQQEEAMFRNINPICLLTRHLNFQMKIIKLSFFCFQSLRLTSHEFLLFNCVLIIISSYFKITCID